jgi:tRNA-2-methylthio-N6-dimethylallyladenosine synthase
VVPYTRGREVYRDPEDIVAECRRLVSQGYKEITLLGQTVNSYNHAKANFAELLKLVDAITGDFWIRFVSSHPNFFSPDVIQAWRTAKHITPYLHLAVQSGNDVVLQRMNRKYTIEKFKDVVAQIRAAVPRVAVSTDVIVGYSGETEEHFNQSVQLFEDVKFDMAYIAQYSVRKGTVGAKLYADDVPIPEKKRRDRELNSVLERVALANNQKYVNQNVRVLVEGHTKGFWMGKSESYKTVKIKPPTEADNLTGQFVDVKISQALPWGLLGEKITV